MGTSPFGAEIFGEPSDGTIVLVGSQPAWAERFEVERTRIRAACGDGAVRVEHVGSTAVPGLAAKPIVDIQVSVADVEDEATYRPALEHAGYRFRVREPAHRMFRTQDHGVHVHVCDAGSDWEQRHLLFRDWLRTSPEDRQRYEATKRQLAARDWPTMDHYAQAKSDVIAEIMERAEAWARTARWSVEDSAPSPTEE